MSCKELVILGRILVLNQKVSYGIYQSERFIVCWLVLDQEIANGTIRS